jgi:signal transduction histidine kinase
MEVEIHSIPARPGGVSDTPTIVHQEPPRRRFLGSLRWRLSLGIIGLVVALLVILSVVLALTVNQLLIGSASQRFVAQARSAAAVRRGTFYSDVLHKGATGACTTTISDAFTATLSDPLTQPPALFQTVALLDPFSGRALAPPSDAGMQPPDLNLAQLARLDGMLDSAGARSWAVGITRGTSVTYATDDGGVPGEAILIAYGYRIVTDCATGQAITLPAVLLISQSFAGTQQTVHQFIVLLMILVVALAALGLGFGVWLTGASLKRLKLVTQAARRLARGDLTQRARLGPVNDEIGDLGQTFDEMASRLENAFRRIEASDRQMRQFISDASHELRTPLASIRGYLGLLEAGRQHDAADAAQMIRTARSEADRMTRMVNDLLTLVRFDAGRPLDLVWTDLGDLAGQAVDQARLWAGERLVTLHGGGFGRVQALVDADRIKQVLLALLDNALKYGRQDATGHVQVTLDQAAESVTIAVVDNGPGIPPQDLPYIFDRFYRGGRNGHGEPNGGAPPAEKPDGSGLGLAIVRTIVQAHGGSVSVESHSGMGTRFIITLPVTVPTTTAQLPAPQAT